MSFIDLPMDPEDIDKPVAEGEYELIINDVQERKNDNGDLKGLLIIHDIVGDEKASQVLHNVSLPLPGDDDQKIKNKMRFMGRYLALFGISSHGGHLNLMDFPGKRARVFLTIETYEGVDSNKIKLK